MKYAGESSRTGVSDGGTSLFSTIFVEYDDEGLTGLPRIGNGGEVLAVAAEIRYKALYAFSRELEESVIMIAP